MKDNKIIAFSGRQRVGKTMSAEALKDEYGGKILSFGNYLKEIVASAFDIDIPTLNSLKNKNESIKWNNSWIRSISNATGIDPNIIKEKYNANKDNIISYRNILQFIGTDVIRSVIPNWHIKQLSNDVEKYIQTGNVYIDDVRFINELNCVENLGGECYFIIRPFTTQITNHASETSLKWDNFVMNKVIINDIDKNTYLQEIVKLYDMVKNMGKVKILLTNFPSYYHEGYTNHYFGMNSCNKNVEKVIKQNQNNLDFWEHGEIKIDYKSIKELRDMSIYTDSQFLNSIPTSGTIKIYNPLIHENLKQWMEVPNINMNK